MKLINKERDLFVLIFLATLIVFSPIIYVHSYLKTNNLQTDFHQHMLWAMDLKAQGMQSLPTYIIAHSGWQILLVIINSITGVTFQKADFVLTLLCAEATAFSLVLWFLPVFKKNLLPGWQRTGLIIGLMVAAPISLLWPLDGLMYLGYMGITSYHNPTMYLLKPFAVLQFIFACKCIIDNAQVSKWDIGIAALVSLLGTFAKPSLAICILPVMGCLTIYNLIKKRYVNLYGVIFGLGIPSVLVLVWQFLLTYYGNDTSSVEFTPFTVMGNYSNYLFIKFLLSILFPLLVLCLQFRQAFKDPSLMLAWAIFLIGTFFSFFLSESGYRSMDGNFIWSGEISLFLLFCASTLFYLNTPPGKLKSILQASWLLHITSGIAYYFYCLFNNIYF